MNYLNEDQGVTTGTIESVAVRILKEQAKLGKLQSLTVSVRFISEQKRKRMIQAGVLGVALLTAGGFIARGAKKNNEEYKKRTAEREKKRAAQNDALRRSEEDLYAVQKELEQKKADFKNSHKARMKTFDDAVKQINDNGTSISRTKKEMEERYKSAKLKKDKKRAASDAELRRMSKDLDDLLKDDLPKSAKSKRKKKKEFDFDAEIRRQEKDLNDLNFESWDSVEEAFFEKKSTIYVEAKYKYGTKVFEVFSATPETVKSSQLDKRILNEVKTSVNRMKNNGFSVREDLTVEAYKEIKLTTSLLEDFNFLL